MTTASPSNTHAAIPTASDPQLNALLHGAGIAPLDHTGWIRVTGSDRTRWLNGMATNSVQDLAPGTGAYNFFLNAQGRIQADGNIFVSEDELLIETNLQQVPTLIPYLDHYIIMDDVELVDITESRHGLTLIGPQAPSLLAKLGIASGSGKELESQTLSWNSSTVIVIRAHGDIVPRFELWTANAEGSRKLRQALEGAGAVPCEQAAIDWLRVLEGTPLYGTDIRDRDLPQETNQTRALHFNKGCYLGQEIVERIRSRGSVHRTFTTFRLEGSLPPSGTALTAGEKQVGELTSAMSLPISNEDGGSLQLGLGYIRREALDRREPLHYLGGVASPTSSPISTTATEPPPQASDS